MMRTQAFIKALLDRARGAGFEDAEVYFISGDSFEANVHDGEIQSYDVSSSLGLGFRGLIGGRMGYAATQVLDDAAIDQLVEGAKTNAQLIENDDVQFLFAGGDSYPDLELYNPALERVTAKEKLDKVLALEKATRTIDQRVTQISDCALFTSRSVVRITNTRGLDLSFEDGGCGMYVAPVARQGDQTNSPLRFVYGRDFEQLDQATLADEAVSEALAGLEGTPVASGNYAIALRNDVAAQILSVFVSVFSADAAQKGLSLLSGREGEQIAGACVAIVDDPLCAQGFSGAPFDGEGVPARKTAVVEGGCLKTLLHNLKTAHKQGVTTTGNAVRGSYASPVTVAPSNFFIQPGARDKGALLRQMGRGLLVTDVQGLHAGANAVTGDFSLAAKGFLIENGVQARPVAGITVAGNFFEMLRAIDAVADDLFFGLPGESCVGSPTILAGTMKVAGQA